MVVNDLLENEYISNFWEIMRNLFGVGCFEKNYNNFFQGRISFVFQA